MCTLLLSQTCDGCECGLTSLQEDPKEWLRSQSQASQPFPLAMFQVSGAHWSQCWPTTLGRHWHCPLFKSQLQFPWEGHVSSAVPILLQTHSEKEKDNIFENSGAKNQIHTYTSAHYVRFLNDLLIVFYILVKKPLTLSPPLM